MDEIYGVLNREKKLNDWEVGGFTPLDLKVNNPSGDWSIYLPVVEFQNRWGYDRLACVSYSKLNCTEINFKHQTGIEKNFSDRFLAKMSGTTRNGNYLDNVFDTARNQGLIEEYLYPDDANSWDEYYKEIPQELKDEAKKFLKEWDLYREWVRTDRKDDIFLALKSSPLQVTVRYANGNDLLNPIGSWNHCVTLFKAEYGYCWYIFDHYTQSIKRYAWDYEFGACLKETLIKKTTNIMTIKNNTFLQLVQGSGGFGLFLDGKIIIDDLAKVQASFLSRTKGHTDDMVLQLTLEEWQKYPHINLKGEAVE